MRAEKNNFIPVAVTVIILAAAGWWLFNYAHRECWQCDRDDFWQRGLEFACSDNAHYRDNSLRFLEKAAEEGSVEAAFFMAELVLGEANGTEIECLRAKVPVNKKDAVQRFHSLEKMLDSAESPPVAICSRLASLYLDGRLPSASPEREAEKWLLRAAEGGDSHAMRELGLLYDAADDYVPARKWFEKAAEDKGNFQAALVVGDYYFYGKGIDPDWNQALSWYEKALEKGKAACAGLAEEKRKKALDPAEARIEIVKGKLEEAGGETPLVIHYRLDGGSSSYIVFEAAGNGTRIGEVVESDGAVTAMLDESFVSGGANATKAGFTFMNQGLEWLLDAFAKSKYGDRAFLFRITGQDTK
jgi:hypothetical protein